LVEKYAAIDDFNGCFVISDSGFSILDLGARNELEIKQHSLVAVLNM